MKCIFCLIENSAKSIEHIVSESFGNRIYVLERSAVCDSCNNRFSKFEGEALSSTIFGMERAVASVVTKKGSTAKLKMKGFAIEGSEDFTPNKITLKNLPEGSISNFDPATGKFNIRIPAFDKTEVPTSKLLLKMGLESLFTSRKSIYGKHDFSDVRDFLLSKSNQDWPFIISHYEHDKFLSIPSFLMKYSLKKLRMELLFSEKDDNILLFKFRFRAIDMIINLINRDLEWIIDYESGNKDKFLYPEHYENKLLKLKDSLKKTTN